MPNINCGGGHSFFMTLLENQQMIFKKNENALLGSKKKENEGKINIEKTRRHPQCCYYCAR